MVSYIAITIGLILLWQEFRRYGVGRAGWCVVGISMVVGYYLVYDHNFGKVVICIVLGVGLYAWRSWFFSLCAALVLMAFLENHETPKGLLGIHGLNPWNFIMANALLSWLVHRRSEGLVWDMPRLPIFLFFCLAFVVVWSFTRMAGDLQKMNIINQSEFFENRQTEYTFTWVFSEYVVNCIKWFLPAILIYDGCRTRKRVYIALASILTIYMLVAIQVNHCMPFSAVTADAKTLARIAARDLDRVIGFFRTEISMMLAGASWGILCCLLLVKERRYQILLIVAAMTTILGQALTGGRAGYVTWGLVGVVFGLVRWRKVLLAIPVIILGVCIFLPAVRDRMMQGLTGNGPVDEAVLTSGRNVAWAHVIPKIYDSPIFGYGRQAMIRTGIYERIIEESNDPGETFPHPHNAYLEILLDDGIFGFVLIMPIYFYALYKSLQLVRDKSDPIFAAIGGVSAALILGLMFASIGSQSFYPKESSVGMWGAIALALRLSVERQRNLATGEPLFGEGVEPLHEEENMPDESLAGSGVPA